MGDTKSFGWGIAATGSIAKTVGEVIAAEPGMRIAAVGSRDISRARALATHLAGTAAANAPADPSAGDPSTTNGPATNGTVDPGAADGRATSGAATANAADRDSATPATTARTTADPSEDATDGATNADAADRLAPADVDAPNAYGSYADLVRDPDVQAVYIATPHAQHLEIAELAIAAGKAVLCEKPLTATVEDAERLIGLAAAANVFVMEAMWMRFNPLIRKAAELIADGRIGELRSVSASFGFPFPYDPSHRLWAPELAGGALLDLGVYPVALAHLLLGTPERISVTGALAPTGVDAEAALLLSWPGGARALLETSLVGFLPNTASIVGTAARIDLDAPFHATTRMVIHPHGGPSEEHTIDSPTVALAAEVREVRDAVTQGLTESPVVPPADSLAVLRILAEARSHLGAVDTGPVDTAPLDTAPLGTASPDTTPAAPTRADATALVPAPNDSTPAATAPADPA